MARKASQAKRAALREEAVAPPAREAPAASLWALPLLLALLISPLIAGGQDLLPALAAALLPWVSLAWRVLQKGLPPLRLPRLWWLLAGFVGAAGASFALSANRGATVTQTLLYASYAITAWLCFDLARGGASGDRGAWSLAAIVAGGFGAAGLGLQEWGFHWRAGETNWRAFSTFTNPNFLAGYVVPALLLALGLALRRPEAFKPGMWAVAVGLPVAVLSAALAVTGSRGGFLALVAGAIVFLAAAVLRGALRRREGLLTVGGLALLAGVVFLLFSAPLRQRTAAVQNPLPAELCPAGKADSTGDSNRFRILTWKGTARMAAKRPVLGWGAGSYATAFAPSAIAGFTRQAHNGYLQLAAEEGGLGLAAWSAVLLAGAIGLWKLPRTEAWAWVPGALGALAAASAHNLVDSILYVPAAGFMTWALVGLGLMGWGSVRKTAARAPAVSRPVVGLAAAGLLFTGLQLSGKVLLRQGRAQISANAGEAVETLRTAQALLPWDPEVPRAQWRAYAYLGRADEAVEAAQRAVNLAPEHPPSYAALARLRSFLRNPSLAVFTYRQGLKHAPDEVGLLYPMARLQEQLGWAKDALQTYRRIYDVYRSPVGQVRALGEVLDYRWARAMMALARDAERTKDRPKAADLRKEAACLLARRRLLHDRDATPYIALGDYEPQTERDLRREEQQLWQLVANDYASRGDTRMEGLAREQASRVERSFENLEKILSDYQAQGGQTDLP